MPREKKKLLLVTNLFPSKNSPGTGPFNKYRVNSAKDFIDWTVWVPVQWPLWLRAKRDGWVSDAQASVSYFPYIYLPKMLRQYYGHFIYWSLRLKLKQVGTVDADVVMSSFGFPDGWAGATLARHLKKPHMVQLLGSDVKVHGQFPNRKKRLQQVFTSSAAILCVSQDLANDVEAMGVDKGKIHVVYNGVDFDQFDLSSEADSKAAEWRSDHGLPATAKVILFVGNLVQSKGTKELVAAFSELALEDGALHLVIAGNGPELEPMRKALEAFKERIHLLGFTPHAELKRWYLVADVTCLPSHSEGVPNVLLESMASGTPVVATTVGGIPEVVSQEAGLLVAPKTPAALCAAIKQSLEQDWHPQKIRSSIEHLTWERYQGRLTAIVDQLVDS